MTGITVHWAPVPLGFRGGIVRGYKITYNSSNSTTHMINASHDASSVTLKGDGPAHFVLTATDMGGERTPRLWFIFE